MLSTKALLLLIVASAATTRTLGFGLGQRKAATPGLPLPTYDAATNRYTASPDDDLAYPYDAVGAALRYTLAMRRRRRRRR